MTEELTDWRIQVVLDRRALVEDIDKLVRIPSVYVKALHPRKLPT